MMPLFLFIQERIKANGTVVLTAIRIQLIILSSRALTVTNIAIKLRLTMTIRASADIHTPVMPVTDAILPDQKEKVSTMLLPDFLYLMDMHQPNVQNVTQMDLQEHQIFAPAAIPIIIT
jgi:hypothetical protein